MKLTDHQIICAAKELCELENPRSAVRYAMAWAVYSDAYIAKIAATIVTVHPFIINELVFILVTIFCINSKCLSFSSDNLPSEF